MQTGLPGMRSRELLLFNVACESATLRMIALPGAFRTPRAGPHVTGRLSDTEPIVGRLLDSPVVAGRHLSISDVENGEMSPHNP